MVAESNNCRGESTLKTYYKTKIEEAQQLLAEKQQNVRRLQAQRNELNNKVRMLKEELAQLHEQGSYVGEVSKVMDKKKVLVKVHPEGKYVVDLDKGIEVSQLNTGCRVALRADSYTLHKILPNKVDPLVSLMMVEKVPDSTYEMIGGLDNQIKEIKEVIELPVKHPELFEALGIAQPKGVLLYGPPGTGKTLLARAVAHHTECTFIRVSGSELVQKFIGEGARMVRELFVMAREHAPSIIFMDEIDSIGSSRVEGHSGGDSEVQRTMLELLNQLDGFEATKNIKVIMATNRIDILDPALLRPGRIDRKIEFPAPDEKARADILKIHSRKMNLMRGINMKKIAEAIPGASGAEVKAVCTEAGMFALRERRIHVTQEDFEMAVDLLMAKVFHPFKALENLASLAVVWVNGPGQTTFPAAWLDVWNNAKMRYCTDGAANKLQPLCEQNTAKSPHVIAGDFDSILPSVRSYFSDKSNVIHIEDQNYTDLTKTLPNNYINNFWKECTSVVVFGGFHGRFDHVLGALNSLLSHVNTCNLPIVAIDDDNVITVLREGHTEILLDKTKITKICGLIPFCQNETRVTTRGFRWDLESQNMEFGGLISTSNEIVNERLQVQTSAPLIFTFQLKDAKVIR
ncbi:ATPase family associated with various cellular activities (AAA) domain-containing protein [Ditylenchus destructor]|uniref:26S proteasome regulatory subunit 8 n=1 Tax=Ditylenchus destructor TaxID=166010 RepID=A0AAD4R596_9BILA|nr:ATPase family associated with various cellular activities (AAA) domain-containing protein [Ditylenchus destructor]